MTHMFLVAVLAANLIGCASLTAMQNSYQERERETQARIDQLSPEDRDKVGKCVAVAEGKIATLRNSGQAGIEYAAANELSIANDCLNNPYYYASIPNPAPPPSTVTCNTTYGAAMSTTRCN
jgi:hypothetical protein